MNFDDRFEINDENKHLFKKKGETNKLNNLNNINVCDLIVNINSNEELLVLCDKKNANNKIIVQKPNGTIELHDNQNNDFELNDIINDTSVLVYKKIKLNGKSICLIETDIYKYRLHYFLSEKYKRTYFYKFKIIKNSNFIRKAYIDNPENMYNSFIEIIKKYPKLLNKYNKETYLLHGSTSPSLHLFKRNDGLRPQNWFKNKKYNTISGEKMIRSEVSLKYVSTVPLSIQFYHTALSYSAINRVNYSNRNSELVYNSTSFYLDYNKKNSRIEQNIKFLNNYSNENKSLIDQPFQVLYCLNIDGIDNNNIGICYSNISGEIIVKDGFNMNNISSILVPKNKLEKVKKYIGVSKLNSFKIDLKSFEDVFKQNNIKTI